MVQKWEKFISKNPYKNIINEIIIDILNNKLDDYYIKKLTGYDNYFRIRKGNIRIVFQKSNQENKIVAVDTRGNIYRGLK
ncbi:MAG: hypothetical protein PHS49_00740 [Candidatus Gracilibacteria bacterium]|nr:hypothetical protein [Candidatus Gracilibacteria bacterium]